MLSSTPLAGGERSGTVTVDKTLIDRLKLRGEEFFGQISGQLMANPQFMKAMEHAVRGKRTLDQAVGPMLKQMNIPTRIEFKKALERIEALEAQLAALKAEKAPRKRPAPRKKAARSRT
jgi:polyhydroxyalkanoate synthesis regulator phasin